MEIKKPVRLLDQVRERIRYLHYSRRTAEAYVFWIKRFILFHNKRHPRDIDPQGVTDFLNYLANRNNVAASTQNQALTAIIFLYKEILGVDVGQIPEFQYARKQKRLPTVLTQDEVLSALDTMKLPYKTMAGLMHGAGMRLHECLTLRVLDVDFARKEIRVRMGKGGKDRITMLPEGIFPGLQSAIRLAKTISIMTSEQGLTMCICRVHWQKSIQMQARGLNGSLYSHQEICLMSRSPVEKGGITYIRSRWKQHSVGPYARSGS